MSCCRVRFGAVLSVLLVAWPALSPAQDRGAAAPAVEVTTGHRQVSPEDPNMAPARADVAGAPVVEISALAPGRSLRPATRDSWAMPDLRWDGHPQGRRWTTAVMSALRGPGADLLEVVPRDIQAWCPGYPAADRGRRAAFWAGLISTLAWHESTHRPRAVGGGGRWFGLVQIAPGTARWRNCNVRTGQGLLDGAANLRCGVRIMAITVPRDGVVAEGMRGVAADWGPFHSRRKREDMRNWIRAQDYCQSPTRPDPRPVTLMAGRTLPVSGAMRAVAGRPEMRPLHLAAVAPFEPAPGPAGGPDGAGDGGEGVADLALAAPVADAEETPAARAGAEPAAAVPDAGIGAGAGAGGVAPRTSATP